MKHTTTKIEAGRYDVTGSVTGDTYRVERFDSQLSGRTFWRLRRVENGEHVKIANAGSVKRKKDAMAEIDDIEREALAVQRAREHGLEVERRIVFSGGSKVIMGVMGGKRWHVEARLRVNGDPITIWINSMNREPGYSVPEMLARAAQEVGHTFTALQVSGLTRAACRELQATGKDASLWCIWSNGGLGGGNRGPSEYVIR